MTGKLSERAGTTLPATLENLRLLPVFLAVNSLFPPLIQTAVVRGGFSSGGYE